MSIDTFSQSMPGLPAFARAGWPAPRPAPATPAPRLAAWHADQLVLGAAGDRPIGGNLPGYAPQPAGPAFDFSARDGNRDGVLSGREVAGLDPAALRALDTDGNGELSGAEHARGALTATARARDANGDGYLSGNELTPDLDRFAYAAADGRRILTAAHLEAALAKGTVPPVTPPVAPPLPGPAPAYGPVSPPVAPTPAPYAPSPAPYAPPTPPYAPAPTPYPPGPSPYTPAPTPPVLPQPVPIAPPLPQPVPFAPPQPQPAPAPPRKGCCPGH